MQDYGGQDILVYDDFDYNSVKIEDFKKAIDPYTSTSIGRRYRNVLFTGELIIICTNIPITEWFEFDDERSRQAIFRRIDTVLDFKSYEDLNNNPDLSFLDNCGMPEYSEGVSYYTINDIIETNKYQNICGKNGSVVKSCKVMELRSIDNKLYEFDLKKFFDFNADKAKRANFLEKLKKM